MEQPQLSTPTDKPTVVPPPSADRITEAANTTEPTETNVAAESSQESQSLDHDRIHNSEYSLRFPRPLGNRQLTNWISSSSPDIMQPENFTDDDLSLAELGYDVIGTDGESQAESTTSSFDYQRPDDAQSLAGTDTGTDVDTNEADTDSSEDEDDEVPTIVDSAAARITSCILPVDDDEAEDEDDDVETLANQSLENPTDFSQHGLIRRLAQSDQSQVSESPAMADVASTQDITPDDEYVKEDPSSPVHGKPKSHGVQCHRLALRYIQGNRRILVILSSLAIFYSLAIAGKYFLFSPSTPRALSTVPVASISSAAVPSPIGSTLHTSTSASIATSTQTQKALQTGSSPSNHAFMPFVKDKDQAVIVSQAPKQNLCSAELSGRNVIRVKIPEKFQSLWLPKDAILIAVSRGLYDIPTKVTSVEEGFLIEVPIDEAHDILAVTIVTTHIIKINETFHVNFGRNKFTNALDAGKQLVKGFAQKFVDTVNETTAWVEESYIPALDTMSKQVCNQTSSVSDTLRQGMRDASKAVLGFPTQLSTQVAQLKKSLDAEGLAQRRNQVRLQVVREAQDISDEAALRYLSAQLRSKLWWLQVRGKTEEYQRYLSKAETYLNEKVAEAEVAKKERAERVKKQIWSSRKQERHEKTGSFWNKRARAVAP